jgi:hypothetical protein
MNGEECRRRACWAPRPDARGVDDAELITACGGPRFGCGVVSARIGLNSEDDWAMATLAVSHEVAPLLERVFQITHTHAH